MEWMHRIEAPVIDHGETVLEVKDTKNGPIEVMKMDWIGSVFCLGETGTPDDPGPLMTAGIDPANCPVCEAAAKKTGVSGPVQRFAANIIKYKVRGRGPTPYVLASPVSAEVLIWAYTGRVHGTLYELGSEHGDLRKHDVKLELEDTPAADKWQRMKQISIIVEPAYKDPKVSEYVRDLWKTHSENRATDEHLRTACLGRDVPRQVLLDMVRRAERQWSQAENAGSGGGDGSQADAGFNGISLSEGIDSLLDSDPSADAGRSDTSAQVSGDPFGGTGEFMSQQEKDAAFAAIEAAKAGVMTDDPFGDETPTATGATTTGTAAPGAESRSSTAPKSAQSALHDMAHTNAVEQAADDMSGEAGNGSASPAPAGAKTRQRKAKAEEPKPEEPARVPAGSGDVIDFDDLFKD